MIPPLTWVALAFVAGLVIADLTGFPLSTGLACLIGISVLWFVLIFIKRWSGGVGFIRKNPRLGIPPILLLISFLIGMVRMQMVSLPFSETDLAWYNGKGVVKITGVINDYPDRRNAYQLITVNTKSLSLGEIQSMTLPVSGKVLVTTGISTPWAYGDEILMIGRLTKPSDEADFSYRDYLARRSIHTSLYYPEIVLIASDHGNPILGWLYTFRDKALGTLSHIFPSPESALLSGILLGVDNDIPPEIQTAFRNTGTTHIIAISGFNISILAALFSSIFYQLFGLRKGAFITAVTLGIYIIIAGASPSVIRAAIMGSLGLFASLIGRKQTGINSLAFAGATMCLVNPFLPWDVSFQLSFMSTLGLILFAESMVNLVKRMFARLFRIRLLESTAAKVGEYCLFTIAALITTFPIMAYHFQTFSWLSLITNPLILPAQPAVMIMGGLALLLGMFWLPLGQLVAYLAWPFVAYTIKIVDLFNSATGNPTISIQIGPGFIVLYYAIIILVFLIGTGSFVKRLLQPGLIILISTAIVIMLWRTGLNTPDDKLHVVVLENGPSENLLIRSPTGRYLLISGGSQSSQLAAALGQWMSPGRRELDLVILPVSDKQAIRSIRHGISGVGINQLIWLGDPSTRSAALELEDSIPINNITSSINFEESTYQLSPEVYLTLNVIQNDSGVLSLRWEHFYMLIPIRADRSDWLVKSLNTDPHNVYSVIMLAGNGTQDLNPAAIIREVNPMLVVVNSDPGGSGVIDQNMYGDGTILTTEHNGWVHIITDGKQLWVETARNPE